MPHIRNHAIDEDEVMDVLDKPGEDRPGREASRIPLGQTSAGRYLRIIYVPDPEPNSVFVITAYELSGNRWPLFGGAEGRSIYERENVPARVG